MTPPLKPHCRPLRCTPARDIFPPLPSQADIWQAEDEETRMKRMRPRVTTALRHGVVALPPLPFAELLMPLGMLTLSLFR